MPPRMNTAAAPPPFSPLRLRSFDSTSSLTDSADDNEGGSVRSGTNKSLSTPTTDANPASQRSDPLGQLVRVDSEVIAAAATARQQQQILNSGIKGVSATTATLSTSSPSSLSTPLHPNHPLHHAAATAAVANVSAAEQPDSSTSFKELPSYERESTTSSNTGAHLSPSTIAPPPFVTGPRRSSAVAFGATTVFSSLERAAKLQGLVNGTNPGNGVSGNLEDSLGPYDHPRPALVSRRSMGPLGVQSALRDGGSPDSRNDVPRMLSSFRATLGPDARDHGLKRGSSSIQPQRFSAGGTVGRIAPTGTLSVADFTRELQLIGVSRSRFARHPGGGIAGGESPGDKKDDSKRKLRWSLANNPPAVLVNNRSVPDSVIAAGQGVTRHTAAAHHGRTSRKGGEEDVKYNLAGRPVGQRGSSLTRVVQSMSKESLIASRQVSDGEESSLSMSIAERKTALENGLSEEQRPQHGRRPHGRGTANDDKERSITFTDDEEVKDSEPNFYGKLKPGRRQEVDSFTEDEGAGFDLEDRDLEATGEDEGEAVMIEPFLQSRRNSTTRVLTTGKSGILINLAEESAELKDEAAQAGGEDRSGLPSKTTTLETSTMWYGNAEEGQAAEAAMGSYGLALRQLKERYLSQWEDMSEFTNFDPALISEETFLFEIEKVRLAARNDLEEVFNVCMELSVKVVELSEDLDRLEFENDDLKAQNQNFQTQIRNLEEKVAVDASLWKNKFKDAMEEIDETEKKLLASRKNERRSDRGTGDGEDDEQRKMYEEFMASLQEAKALKGERAALKRTIGDLTSQLETATARIQEMEEAVANYRNLKARSQASANRLAQLEKDKEALASEVQSGQEKIETLSALLLEFEKREEELTRHLNQIRGGHANELSSSMLDVGLGDGCLYEELNNQQQQQQQQQQQPQQPPQQPSAPAMPPITEDIEPRDLTLALVLQVDVPPTAPQIAETIIRVPMEIEEKRAPLSLTKGHGSVYVRPTAAPTSSIAAVLTEKFAAPEIKRVEIEKEASGQIHIHLHQHQHDHSHNHLHTHEVPVPNALQVIKEEGTAALVAKATSQMRATTATTTRNMEGLGQDLSHQQGGQDMRQKEGDNTPLRLQNAVTVVEDDEDDLDSSWDGSLSTDQENSSPRKARHVSSRNDDMSPVKTKATKTPQQIPIFVDLSGQLKGNSVKTVAAECARHPYFVGVHSLGTASTLSSQKYSMRRLLKTADTSIQGGSSGLHEKLRGANLASQMIDHFYTPATSV